MFPKTLKLKENITIKECGPTCEHCIKCPQGLWCEKLKREVIPEMIAPQCPLQACEVINVLKNDTGVSFWRDGAQVEVKFTENKYSQVIIVGIQNKNKGNS